MRPANHPKAAGHPKLREIEFKFSNGNVVKVRSAAQKTEYQIGDWPLDNHPAWTKSHDNSRMKSATKFAKFQNKFKGLFDDSQEDNQDKASE